MPRSRLRALPKNVELIPNEGQLAPRDHWLACRPERKLRMEVPSQASKASLYRIFPPEFTPEPSETEREWIPMHELTRPLGKSTRWLLNSLLSGDLPGSTPVPPSGLTLGRDGDNDIVLSSLRFPGVSGRHARLEIHEGRLHLFDEGSSNGTWVAGSSVESVELEHGAAFELGAGGPRFVAVSGASLDKTVTMPRPTELRDDSADTSPKLGTETMHLVRAKLGIPEAMGVDQMVTSGSRGTRGLIVLVTLIFAAGVGLTYRHLDGRNHELHEQLENNRELVTAQARELADRGENMEKMRLAWDAEKAALEDERSSLEASINSVQTEEQTNANELANLRSQLLETNSLLEMYNPLNLEQQRLEEVARVERCTVLIEADLLYEEETTGRVLYMVNDGPFGKRVNLDGKGEAVKIEATGSGFSVTSEGWIITNAHVVHKKHAEPPIDLGPDVKLVPRIELRVVFSGESKRHEAKLVNWVADASEDLALLKIEPFEDMPYLKAPMLEAPPPSRGTEVFLIGFPLGKRVFHQGDTMLASTFRGVLSRILDEYLQVDAAVHPGASGGPLIDGHGRLLGVVVGMQTLSDSATSSAIGYIIPAKQLESIWPPEGFSLDSATD